jgi:eukaryotic-like serine/threonine-protein kinase
MEYVEGESLASRIAHKHLSVREVIDVVSAICAGLEAAHAAGIIHRDLKPDNVLLANDRVVITDFGVARTQEPGDVKRTMAPIGTPAYMAPEQVEASPDIDARADIYALGVMMFELLAHRLPFEADSVFAVAAMRLTQPPPDPRTIRFEVPESMALLVQACMARKPQDRPQSAREIASRLATMTLPVISEGVRSRAIPPPRESQSWHKTVAVLPFRNAGPPEDDYLVDGLTDDLIDALSMTPGLRVRPRGVVMPYRAVRHDDKDATNDPRRIGRELGVQVVVDGTVRTAADAIRVSARVLSVEDGFQVWAKRFEGARADVLHIGDDASRAIAEALAVETPEREAPPTDPVAIDLYLRGRHELFKFWGAATTRAIDLLADAHNHAPRDPLIMAGYAMALARQFGTSASLDRHATARRVAEEAVAMAPQLAEAQIALAAVKLHEPDPIGAATGVTRALMLNPLLPEAHQLRARLMSEVATPREAIEAVERAIQLEPRLEHLRYDVQARSRALLHEWDINDYTTPADPDLASSYWITAARMTLWSRDSDTLQRVAEKLNGTTLPSLFVQVFTRLVLDRHMSTEHRARLAERASSEQTTKRMQSFWNQLNAELKGYAGEPSLDEVRSAVHLGLIDLAWMDGCPLLDECRQDPAFAELRATVAARARAVHAILTGSDATLAG